MLKVFFIYIWYTDVLLLMHILYIHIPNSYSLSDLDNNLFTFKLNLKKKRSVFSKPTLHL